VRSELRKKAIFQLKAQALSKVRAAYFALRLVVAERLRNMSI
jgi:hypothetical protein